MSFLRGFSRKGVCLLLYKAIFVATVANCQRPSHALCTRFHFPPPLCKRCFLEPLATATPPAHRPRSCCSLRGADGERDHCEDNVISDACPRGHGMEQSARRPVSSARSRIVGTVLPHRDRDPRSKRKPAASTAGGGQLPPVASGGDGNPVRMRPPPARTPHRHRAVLPRSRRGGIGDEPSSSRRTDRRGTGAADSARTRPASPRLAVTRAAIVGVVRNGFS